MILSGPSSAQIIPPALGEISSGSWLAFGVNQDLDTIKSGGWQSSTYIGIGKLNPAERNNPFKQQGIFVLNQEFHNRFHTNWEYSLALSYRKQEVYSKNEPFIHADPRFKNEFRVYGRFSRLFKTDFVEITPTFRQEIINYFTPDFKDYRESLRLRSRFRLKFAFPLDQQKSHRLIFYSEQLFSISQEKSKSKRKWTSFDYKDSRFSLYYSLSPQHIPFTFNLGYMHNLIGKHSTHSAHYIALDMIWKNPFNIN